MKIMSEGRCSVSWDFIARVPSLAGREGESVSAEIVGFNMEGDPIVYFEDHSVELTVKSKYITRK